MQQEGWLRTPDVKEIQELAESVLQHVGLRALLDKPYQRFDERTIITRDGSSYRPDKVLTGSDETWILDFKFTREKESSHIKQVNEYKMMLQEMGYKNIKGHLFYGFTGELIGVEE